jgi:hypothetical protein
MNNYAGVITSALSVLQRPDVQNELRGYFEAVGEQKFSSSSPMERLALMKAHETAIATMLSWMSGVVYTSREETKEN